MRNRIFRSGLAWVCLSLMAAAPALRGYVVRKDKGGELVSKWQTSPVVMQVKLSATANLIDGGSQRSSVLAGLQAWNAQLGTLQFVGQASTPGDYAIGNRVNEIVMAGAVDGEAFPAGVLAVTFAYGGGNDYVEADIIFNSAYTWNSYRGGVRNGVEDIQRVAIHELGHALGLDHPDEAGQSVTAVMNSQRSAIDRLQGDDIAGGRFLYGAPGVRPVNDAFANATAITLNGDEARLTGSNIGATREAGEKGHAGATSLHSVWWKWTATGNGAVIVDTRGSNFDTVLAVYTGSSVSALTEVASNDDEERLEDNPTPQRKRTSKVEFDVVSGAIYHLAVDGWGDEERVRDGYTGEIKLGVAFSLVVPPVVIAQPADDSVAAGGLAHFSVGLSGRPFPDRQWQRRRAGTSEWLDVPQSEAFGVGESVNHDFTGTSRLSVETDFAMNGDQFRCVASNRAGTVYSDAAVLNVAAIQLPVISAQPQGRRFLSGISARLSVTAEHAVSYQWYRDGVALAGETKALLYFPNPQASDAGKYHVVLTNPGGSVTSATATITIGPPAVVTNKSPTRQLVVAGDTLSLSVSATGTGTLRYQWYHDGRTISGAAAPSYTRPVKSRADAGAYWVAVTDDMGTRHGAPFFAILAPARTNVVAWGANYAGQMEVPTDLIDAVAVSAAPQYGLAVRRGGTVAAWGETGALEMDFRDAVAVSAGGWGAMALRADGAVVASGAASNVPAGLKEVCAIAMGSVYALALKTDGTVEAWGSEVPPVNSLEDIVAISESLALRRDGLVFRIHESSVFVWEDTPKDNIVAIASGGGVETLALKADGTLAWNPAPAAAVDVVGIAAGYSHALALKANGTVVAWNGSNAYGEVDVPSGLGAVLAIAAGGSASFALRDISASQPLLITAQPSSRDVFIGHVADFWVNAASGTALPANFQWQHNGHDVVGATGRSYTIGSVRPRDAGVYTVIVNPQGERRSTEAGILGARLLWSQKLAGDVAEVGSDILHPNGNTFDQLLLEGGAASYGADYDEGQITRLSFIDLDHDIVQVELSGPGTLSIVLDSATGPEAPQYYHQPGVNYVRGHAGIVIAGADERTNVSVFTVGRATAFDPTGRYDITRAIGPANDPARNGSPLFQGHSDTNYDGIADLAFIAIVSADGRFGGVRAANAHFFAEKGCTGLYAPDVTFHGPVYLGDVTAFDEATPVIRLKEAGDVRITGGDLLQENGAAVEVSGIARLKFTAGGDSHGRTLPAQANGAVLRENGRDVTAEIVVRP